MVVVHFKRDSDERGGYFPDEAKIRSTIRGLPSMTSALKGGGGSGKVDNSTDKLLD